MGDDTRATISDNDNDTISKEDSQKLAKEQHEKARDIAKNMLEMNIPTKTIAKATGLELREVEGMRYAN